MEVGVFRGGLTGLKTGHYTECGGTVPAGLKKDIDGNRESGQKTGPEAGLRACLNLN